MEESNQILNYELKTSRNGLSVPVVNGIHLHSIYNPIKEAEAFAAGHAETIKNKANILVLGLGFGYHIEQIAKIAHKEHGNYNIIILEPNKTLVRDFTEKRNFEDSNIKIISTNSVNELFNDFNFVTFLRTKPTIIKHDTSFTLQKDFFTQFLKYQAPTKIDQYMNLLRPELQNYFSSRNAENKNLWETINTIKTETGAQENYDFALLAFEQIANNNNKPRGL